MLIRVNANHTVHTDEAMERWARAHLADSLNRFRHDITSVEVHLSDQNSDRLSEDQKRCRMEARLANLSPVVVNHQAANVDEAFRGAAEKLKRTLEHAYGKLHNYRQRDSIRRSDVLTPVEANARRDQGGSGEAPGSL
jgi:ribosome-associated translation inhibitor RaiA